MEAVAARKQQLEEMNRHLCQNAGEVRESVRDLALSNEKFRELLDFPDEKLSIKEYVAMCFYEAVLSLWSQLAKLSMKRDKAAEELDTNRTHMKGLMESNEEERQDMH